MTTLALALPLFEDVEREPSLDDIVVRAWEGVSGHGVVECPVCQGEMEPEYGAQARPVAGRCSDCGAAIS